MTQWIIIGAAVLVLVIGGVWLIMRDRNPEPANTTTNLPITTPTTTVTEGNNIPTGTITASNDGESVAVADQKAGSSVAITSMELTRASWIAIRDDKSILGASWFASSATSGSVKLQRETVSGKTYRAVVYVDDGDKKFDFKKDRLITVDEAPLGVSFEAN